jgi:hypothetical protein
MVLHLSHVEGGFGEPFNCVTKDAAFLYYYDTFCVVDGCFLSGTSEVVVP